MSDGNPLIFFSEWPLAIRSRSRNRRYFQLGQCFLLRRGGALLVHSPPPPPPPERESASSTTILSLGYKSDV